MGADTQLFSRMAEAGPNGIKIIGIDGLVALNVVNGRAFKEDWTFKSIPEGIYLVGMLVDDRGTSKTTFVCDRKSKKLVSTIYIPESPNPNGDVTLASIFVTESIDAGYFVDNEIHRLKSAGRSVTLIPQGEKPSDPSQIQVIWPVLPADVAAISSARSSTGFALLSVTPGIWYGFHLDLGDQGADMIRNYATDCWR